MHLKSFHDVLPNTSLRKSIIKCHPFVLSEYKEIGEGNISFWL